MYFTKLYCFFEINMKDAQCALDDNGWADVHNVLDTFQILRCVNMYTIHNSLHNNIIIHNEMAKYSFWV